MLRFAAAVLAIVVAWPCSSADAQTGRKPAPPRKPAVPAAPAPKPKPEPPPPADVRYTSRYTTGDQVTESVTYIRGNRERYELADMVLIRQHDEKRTIQLSRAADMYLVTPTAAAPADASVQATSGKVLVETTYTDTGERKTVFGVEARRVKTLAARHPQPGACDTSTQQIETDGWYIDAPKAIAALPPFSVDAPTTACHEVVEATQKGDVSLLGFPISYTKTVTAGDEKPIVVSMEVTALEVITLDAGLFEAPDGMAAASDARELAKAVSDANEAQLAAADSAAVMPPDKKPDQIRVGVPELANKTTSEVDTRALRTQLIAGLAEKNLDAVPLAAAPQLALDARAKASACDYLLMAEVVELKTSNPGRLGRMVRSTAGDATKPVTEAKLNVQLVPVGAAKARLTTTVNGKDGGIGIKTGLRLARVAAQLYLRYASPLGALNAMQMMNLGGMGMLDSPLLMQMQGGGLTGSGRGIDRTAGAAMFLMEQAMSAAGDGPETGPSFDASLGDALAEAANKTADTLKKK